MIDQVLGRPSSAVRRTEVFMVLFFWIWRLYKGGTAPAGLSALRARGGRAPVPRFAYRSAATAHNGAWWRRIWAALVARSPGAPRWSTRLNQRLKRFTPYQLIIATFTMLYAFQHLDDLLGIAAPEPMAGMYSRSFYRASYVNTAFDAGFASAMSIKPKWIKDIASVAFTLYYLIFSRQADEVLRRWRALCSVEMLRTTWEKTNNPYLRWFTAGHRAKLPLVQYVSISRPKTSSRANLPPVKAMLLFDGTAEELEKVTQLIMDFPGGGFVAMGPECHEERLRIWAKRTGKAVLSVDYGKAPEYPYPWAIEEGIDAYRTITDSKGSVLGIKSGKLGVVLTGDSAGGNICTTIMNRILEHRKHIDRPVAMILAYPALDFNYTSWMSPTNLRVLQTEQSETHIPGLLHGKDHLAHKAPLSVVDDTSRRKRNVPRRSWADSITGTFGITMTSASASRSESPGKFSRSTPSSPVMRTHPMARSHSKRGSGWFAPNDWTDDEDEDDESSEASDSQSDRGDEEKSLAERVKTPGVHADERFTGGILEDALEDSQRRKKHAIGARLTMTSRVGYFQDRIITPSMMRAMAILYIGPNASPDFETDYYISPLLSPAKNLGHFPPVYLICGERDPFVDDTVIFAGKLREAKRTRRSEAERQANGRGAPGPESDGPPTNGTELGQILHETDDDWVQMRIIEGWGHGFMQMTALMREVESVLVEMADWIDESFEHEELARQETEQHARAIAVASAQPDAHERVSVSPDRGSRPRHVKPATEYKATPAHKELGTADLDDDGMISFKTTKATRRRPLPSSQFIPVPRRASRESLLLRNNSAPRFDMDDSTSSGEALETPPDGTAFPHAPVPRAGGTTFGLFGPRQVVPVGKVTPKSAATSLYSNSGSGFSYGSRRASPVPRGVAGNGHPGAAAAGSGNSTGGSPGTSAPSTQGTTANPLLAAVSATTRAASPALAAAGIVPQQVQNVSQAELYRRRRQEMLVAGMDHPSGASGGDGA